MTPEERIAKLTRQPAYLRDLRPERSTGIHKPVRPIARIWQVRDPRSGERGVAVAVGVSFTWEKLGSLLKRRP